jgi:hypothetical protein
MATKKKRPRKRPVVNVKKPPVEPVGPTNFEARALKRLAADVAACGIAFDFKNRDRDGRVLYAAARARWSASE